MIAKIFFFQITIKLTGVQYLENSLIDTNYGVLVLACDQFLPLFSSQVSFSDRLLYVICPPV
jgi:hypothetical protein